MDRVGQYVGEVTRALLVLAVVLLNFAPHPAPVVASDGFAFTTVAAVFCGDSGQGDQTGHAPCHACRIGGDALLPPPPCTGEPVRFDTTPVSYAVAEVVYRRELHFTAHRSRGPPPIA